MISVLLRHYLFCFLGASVRYLLNRFVTFNRKNKKKLKFSEVWNYEKNKENQILDAIIGFFVLGLIYYIVFGLRWS